MSLDATFDGVSASSVGVKVLSADRSALPAMRDQKIDIPGRPGSIIFPAVPGDRTITVSVGLVAEDGADYQDQLRALAGWLWTQGKRPLVFSDEPDKMWLAAVDPTDAIQLEREIEIGTVDIEFVADAYAYKTVTETVQWDTGASPTITVTNEGTVDAELVFEFEADEELLIPRFQCNDGLLVLPNLLAGQTLVVDGNDKSIERDGLSFWTGVAGDFFALRPGENEIAFASNGGSVSVQVSWVPRWL
jgi:predicted phage tail component-like protein